MMHVHIALVHYPIRNRHGETVSTAVTNLDIHDLARTATSYGCAGYTLVTPLLQQREMVRRIADHWVGESGKERNPIRARAFECLTVESDLAATKTSIAKRHGGVPVWTLATGASYRENDPNTPLHSWNAARSALADNDGAALIVFGTGWGLIESLVTDTCDGRLPAIDAMAGRDGYNHLPVRAAVAIALDRLLGARPHVLP